MTAGVAIVLVGGKVESGVAAASSGSGVWVGVIVTGVTGVEVGGKVDVGKSVGASVGTSAILTSVGTSSVLAVPPQATPNHTRHKSKKKDHPFFPSLLIDDILFWWLYIVLSPFDRHMEQKI